MSKTNLPLRENKGNIQSRKSGTTKKEVGKKEQKREEIHHTLAGVLPSVFFSLSLQPLTPVSHIYSPRGCTQSTPKCIHFLLRNYTHTHPPTRSHTHTCFNLGMHGFTFSHMLPPSLNCMSQYFIKNTHTNTHTSTHTQAHTS